MLAILSLAKVRCAVPISAAISAKRATRASGKIDANPCEREAEWRLPASLVVPPLRDEDAPHSLLAIRPSASTRDPLQYFNSLLRDGRIKQAWPGV